MALPDSHNGLIVHKLNLMVNWKGRPILVDGGLFLFKISKMEKEIDLSHLTNESAMVLSNIMKCLRIELECDEVLFAINQADLTKYWTQEMDVKKYGSHPKMSDTIGCIYHVIGGMANRIDELEKQLNESGNKQG